MLVQASITNKPELTTYLTQFFIHKKSFRFEVICSKAIYLNSNKQH